MRIWNVKPSLMCRKHLFGEHLEMHMFAGTIKQGKSLNGYIEKGLVETDIIVSRHDELAIEMTKRGYSHNSPLQIEKSIFKKYANLGKIDVENSLQELANRCENCRKLQMGY